MTTTQTRTRQTNPMKRLYSRLNTFGIKSAYVKKIVLPSWWEDEIALNPAGYAEALTLITRNLGLDLASLQTDKGPLMRHTVGPRRFKRQAGVAEEELGIAECIALRAAQLACFATPNAITDVPKAAGDLRAALLEDGKPYITFEALLDACWDYGIPVIHVAQFPQGAKKMDGLAARIGGRPAIVLSCKRPYSAWLEFHLGHEIGHVGRGHLEGDGVLVEDTTRDNEEIDEEREATEYAIELLTGNSDNQYTSNQRPIASTLASASITQGEADRVNPGVIVLNYANATGKWPVATNALKVIESKPNAISLVHAKMRERLDWDRLPEESQAFLMRVTGADPEA